MANNKSIYGLRSVVIAEVLTDDDEGTTYGAVEAVEGAIDLQISPNNADPNIQYADDIEYDVIYPDPDITLTTEFATLPLAVQQKLNGSVLDDNGVLVQKAGDTPPYYAVGFSAARRGDVYRYVWLLKTRAKPISETYHTKEGTTVTRQTGKVEFAAIKRASDGNYMVKADEGENGFTAAMGKTFLSTVYEPTFTAAP